ncbi:hypothetical protein GCM10027430_27780 [Lysobacter tyrosinilyticus]
MSHDASGGPGWGRRFGFQIFVEPSLLGCFFSRVVDKAAEQAPLYNASTAECYANSDTPGTSHSDRLANPTPMPVAASTSLG